MLLSIIILIAILLLKHLYIFLPGVLGAITLYMLSRVTYFRLTLHKKWKKGWTAVLYILGCIVIIGLPIYFTVRMVSPKLTSLFSNPEELLVATKLFSEKIFNYTGIQLFSDENIKNLQQEIATVLPKFLTGTANIISNLLIMLFLFYYMLVNGRISRNFLDNLFR